MNLNEKDPLFTVFGTTELERDIALMDRVKEKFGMKQDRDLAELLGVNKSILSEIRSYAKSVATGNAPEGKHRCLTPLQRLKAFNHLGYAWARDALIAIFPENLQNDLLKIDNERTRAHVEKDRQATSLKAGTTKHSKPGVTAK